MDASASVLFGIWTLIVVGQRTDYRHRCQKSNLLFVDGRSHRSFYSTTNFYVCSDVAHDRDPRTQTPFSPCLVLLLFPGGPPISSHLPDLIDFCSSASAVWPIGPTVQLCRTGQSTCIVLLLDLEDPGCRDSPKPLGVLTCNHPNLFLVAYVETPFTMLSCAISSRQLPQV